VCCVGVCVCMHLHRDLLLRIQNILHVYECVCLCVCSKKGQKEGKIACLKSNITGAIDLAFVDR